MPATGHSGLPTHPSQPLGSEGPDRDLSGFSGPVTWPWDLTWLHGVMLLCTLVLVALPSLGHIQEGVCQPGHALCQEGPLQSSGHLS